MVNGPFDNVRDKNGVTDVKSPFDDVLGRNLSAQAKLMAESQRLRNDHLPEAARDLVGQSGVFSTARVENSKQTNQPEALIFGPTIVSPRNNETEEIAMNNVFGSADQKSQAQTLQPLDVRNQKLNNPHAA